MGQSNIWVTSSLHHQPERLIAAGVAEARLTGGVGGWSRTFGVFGDEPQDQQEAEEAACSTDAGGKCLPGVCEADV